MNLKKVCSGPAVSSKTKSSVNVAFKMNSSMW